MTQTEMFSDELTSEEIRAINDVCGVDVFQRIHSLPTDVYNKFRLALQNGKVDLHCDGYRGFTVNVSDEWSNEGFEL